MERPVLILTPYFAPQSHAAMFRAHKLAKYLPDHGYRPIVVTTDTNYLYNEDPKLLDELPSCVEIHRAGYVEPTLRGLRMALGGEDRTFAAEKSRGRVNPELQSSQVRSEPSTRLKIKRAISETISERPDRHWTWWRAARRLCTELIARHKIRLLYTSANPVSHLKAATSLRQRHSVRWLFDSRDPLGYGKKHTARGAYGRIQEQRILQKAFSVADHVTGLSSAYGSIFSDLFNLPRSKYTFIPTGIDEAYVPDQREHLARSDELLFVGEVMPNQPRYPLDVIARVIASVPTTCRGLKLTFIGRREINQPIVERLFAEQDTPRPQLSFVDHIPQKELYARMASAHACLLVPGANNFWWNNFAKLVDYIGLGTPVVAFVPDISEARRELERAGTAFFLTGDIEQDTTQLSEWLPQARELVPTEYRHRYQARNQAGAIAGVLNSLFEEGATSA